MNKELEKTISNTPKNFSKKVKKTLDKLHSTWYNIIKKRVATNANKERKIKMENTSKMTARNFYNAIANGTINEELMAYAAEAIKKMDEANEKRKTKVSPSQMENEKLKNEIAEKMVGMDYTTAATIAEMMGISPNKASALCRMMAGEKDGRFITTEVKNEKKNKVKAYKLA